ncbi:MAG: hypothetical protein MI784_15560 [Cytophagales bacterium]|nr:hypothetical protein [Cytophagales bacterium]
MWQGDLKVCIQKNGSQPIQTLMTLSSFLNRTGFPHRKAKLGGRNRHAEFIPIELALRAYERLMTKPDRNKEYAVRRRMSIVYELESLLYSWHKRNSIHSFKKVPPAFAQGMLELWDSIEKEYSYLFGIILDNSYKLWLPASVAQGDQGGIEETGSDIEGDESFVQYHSALVERLNSEWKKIFRGEASIRFDGMVGYSEEEKRRFKEKVMVMLARLMFSENGRALINKALQGRVDLSGGAGVVEQYAPPLYFYPSRKQEAIYARKENEKLEDSVIESRRDRLNLKGSILGTHSELPVLEETDAVSDSGSSYAGSVAGEQGACCGVKAKLKSLFGKFKRRRIEPEEAGYQHIGELTGNWMQPLYNVGIHIPIKDGREAEHLVPQRGWDAEHGYGDLTFRPEYLELANALVDACIYRFDHKITARQAEKAAMHAENLIRQDAGLPFRTTVAGGLHYTMDKDVVLSPYRLYGQKFMDEIDGLVNEIYRVDYRTDDFEDFLDESDSEDGKREAFAVLKEGLYLDEEDFRSDNMSDLGTSLSRRGAQRSSVPTPQQSLSSIEELDESVEGEVARRPRRGALVGDELDQFFHRVPAPPMVEVYGDEFDTPSSSIAEAEVSPSVQDVLSESFFHAGDEQKRELFKGALGMYARQHSEQKAIHDAHGLDPVKRVLPYHEKAGMDWEKHSRIDELAQDMEIANPLDELGIIPDHGELSEQSGIIPSLRRAGLRRVSEQLGLDLPEEKELARIRASMKRRK